MKKSTKTIKKAVKTRKNKIKKRVLKKISKTPIKKNSVVSSWEPLRELALHTPYTMGYLSLMARRKNLKVKKIGRIWYSTMENIKEFEERMRRQKEKRNEELRKSYVEKAHKVSINVMDEKKADKILKQVQEDTGEDASIDSAAAAVEKNIVEIPKRVRDDIFVNGLQSSARGDDTIFDEVQRELQEILGEIRDKEKKLRHNYMVYRGAGATSFQEGANIQRKKKETEQISEKLIEDMGKLLKTANEIHNTAEEHGQFLINNDSDSANKIEKGDHLLGNHHKDNFLSVPYSYFPFEDDQRASKEIPRQSKFLLFVAGIMVFIATMLLVLVIFSQG